MILKMTILIKYTGKFCYGHGNFQNTEALTRGVFKSFIKFTGKSLFFNVVLILLKRTPTQVFSCELCEVFKNTFFPSACFSESLYMRAAVHSCLTKSCSENVW